MRSLRVLTWHVHGNYLLYLARAGVEFVLPVKPGRQEGYGGRGTTFPFGDNVRDVPAEAIRDTEIECILFQTRRNFEVDQFELLSDEQLASIPRIYLQHDPPWGDPTETAHWFDDPNGLLVHVTPFNALMWDSGRTPTRVIDHGVFVPDCIEYTGERARGLVVINHLRQRGRRLGADIFQSVQEQVPLDLVGMESESLGGLGEIFPPKLPTFMARYRFFFNPIRWTSLGLAVIEAMMVGLPIVGLATTELPSVIENGVSGYTDSDVARLIAPMQRLIDDPEWARRLGMAAREYACARFHIDRFAREWEETFSQVAGRPCRGRTLVTTGLKGGVR